MATNLRSDDTIQVVIPQGGGVKRAVTLSELNEYLTSAEETDISTLETYIGDYSSPLGGAGSDIATDLATLYGDVKDDDSGLLVRVDALESVTPSSVTSVDLEAASPYVVLDTDQTIVVTKTDGTGDAITLPAATGSQRKLTISVQAATNAVTVNVAGDPGTETINTAASLGVTALTTVTLLDYATGKWMTL